MGYTRFSWICLNREVGFKRNLGRIIELCLARIMGLFDCWILEYMIEGYLTDTRVSPNNCWIDGNLTDMGVGLNNCWIDVDKTIWQIKI